MAPTRKDRSHFFLRVDTANGGNFFRANSLLIGWLLAMMALSIERFYRLRYLHRGKHRVPSSAQLLLLLWLSLSRPCAADSS